METIGPVIFRWRATIMIGSVFGFVPFDLLAPSI